MSTIGSAFRKHVLGTSIEGCTVTQVDGDHFALETEQARGTVTFYDLGEEFPEIVELSIVDRDAPDEPKFFLHFELEDEARAEELFARYEREKNVVAARYRAARDWFRSIDFWKQYLGID